MNLYYEDISMLQNDQGVTTEAQFNGNISGTIWKNHTTPKERYGFTYDEINRLKTADYGYKDDVWINDANQYDVAINEYDFNGNIVSLERDGESAQIDNLTYSYIGNRLESVNDNSNDTEGFTEVSNTSNEYGYDENGNMTTDLNKGISNIDYNYLNLPELVATPAGNIEYIYDAVGNKLVHINTSGDETYYFGNFVYKRNAGGSLGLSYILFSEGKVIVEGAATSYEYFLKDHLGNTRVVVNENNSYSQISDYYPFGMRHKPVTIDNATQKYLYNGKELQEETDWYDYGARMYDPQLGRFHVVDPLAEWHMNYNPYHYCFNNPINFIDPFGLDTGKTTQVDPYGNPLLTNYIEPVTITGQQQQKTSWFGRFIRNLFSKVDVKEGDRDKEGTQKGGITLYTEGDAVSPTGVKSESEPDMLNYDELGPALGSSTRTQATVPTGKVEAATGIIKRIFDIAKTNSKNNQTPDKQILEQHTGTGQVPKENKNTKDSIQIGYWAKDNTFRWKKVPIEDTSKYDKWGPGR
jgi:RHS repeat-associated protein